MLWNRIFMKKSVVFLENLAYCFETFENNNPNVKFILNRIFHKKCFVSGIYNLLLLFFHCFFVIVVIFFLYKLWKFSYIKLKIEKLCNMKYVCWLCIYYDTLTVWTTYRWTRAHFKNEKKTSERRNSFT